MGSRVGNFDGRSTGVKTEIPARNVRRPVPEFVRQPRASKEQEVTGMSGFHSFSVGQFQCVAVSDGTNAYPAAHVFANAPPQRRDQVLRQHNLPSDAIVLSDTGYSAIWAGSLIKITRPDQLFLRASGSLGWAFPAGLGAKCAYPDRPVVCFSGDGAFWYHLQEIETAVRWEIPTVTVINNNGVLGQSQIGIRRAYGDDRGRETDQYRFMDTDFAAIAEDMGALGIRVQKPGDAGDAIRQALEARRPAVVDVVTEPESFPILK